MATLILLRHAKSDWSGGEPDPDRPLARRGRRQAAESGRWLAGNVADIALAVVSPTVRTRDTWAIVAAELGDPPQVQVDDRVYAASGEELLEVVHGLADDVGTAVLVGHIPGVEEVLELLTGQWVRMPTSAIAVIDLAGAWASAGDGAAVVRASGRPPG